MSYVRGVSGAGNDGGGNEHIARTGPVVTAISARFSDGDAVVRIGGLFWFDGTSSALADLKRRWLFCLSDTPTLDEWLETHRESGARGLKELERASPGLKIYEAKQAFLSRLRSHFDVGDNAFDLLNRAAGLKQLDSIDKVFRELVLDDASAFGDAGKVAEEFDTLAGIRQELETARKQRDTLLPIEKGWIDHQEAIAKLDEHSTLLSLLPAWFGEHAIALWQYKAESEKAELLKQQQQAGTLAEQLSRAIATEQSLQTRYLQAGGQRIEELRRHLSLQEDKLKGRQREAARYQAWAASLGLNQTLTLTAWQENQAAIEQRHSGESQRWSEQQQAAWEAGAKQQGLLAERDQIQKKLDEAKSVRIQYSR